MVTQPQPDDWSTSNVNISRGGGSNTAVRFIIAGISALIAFLISLAVGSAFAYVIGVAVGVVVFLSIVINQEYERAVVFRLGSFDRVFGPGLNFKIPFLEWIQRVDYRVKTANVRPQKVLTKDNVTVTVDAIVFYRVKKASEEIQKAILEVEDFNKVTINYGQTMLRAMIGKKELDEILQNRDQIAEELRKELDKATNDFGVHIRDVEIQDVSIPDSMERAMAAEAEAERERRARITNAQGELQAAARTRLASDIMGEKGYKLRTLQTIDQVAAENSTVVTLPAELMPSGKAEESEQTADVKEIMKKLKDSLEIDDMLGNAEQITSQSDSKEQ